MNGIAKTWIIVIASGVALLICLMPPRDFYNGSTAPRRVIGVNSVKHQSSYAKRTGNKLEVGITFGASSIHIDYPRLMGELLIVAVVTGLGIAIVSKPKSNERLPVASS